MTCVGCGGPGTGYAGLSGVVCCKPCMDRFLEKFDRFIDDPPRAGVTLPEGPETRIADALLKALGEAGAELVDATAPRRAHFVAVPNRVPRRGRLPR